MMSLTEFNGLTKSKPISKELYKEVLEYRLQRLLNQSEADVKIHSDLLESINNIYNDIHLANYNSLLEYRVRLYNTFFILDKNKIFSQKKAPESMSDLLIELNFLITFIKEDLKNLSNSLIKEYHSCLTPKTIKDIYKQTVYVSRIIFDSDLSNKLHSNISNAFYCMEKNRHYDTVIVNKKEELKLANYIEHIQEKILYYRSLLSSLNEIENKLYSGNTEDNSVTKQVEYRKNIEEERKYLNGILIEPEAELSGFKYIYKHLVVDC